MYLMNYIKKELFLKTLRYIDYFLLEKEILHEVKHPFIIKMEYAVSDPDNIYYFLNILTLAVILTIGFSLSPAQSTK